MNLPSFQPQAMRAASYRLPAHQDADALLPQGCSIWKKIGCASALAACATSPAPQTCIMAIAPSCYDCL